MAQTRAYKDGALVAEGFRLEEVSEHLSDAACVVWVDLRAPDERVMHLLAHELGLHELAVEDAMGRHQRPKLDHYDTHLFLSCHAVGFDAATAELDVHEIDAFVGDRWLITVHKDDGEALDEVRRRWDRSTGLAVHGVSFLLYGLLDVVVDGYFEAVDAFDEYYDDVSEGIFAERPLDPAQQRMWFETRRALVRFHRIVVPLREAVSALMRHEDEAVPRGMYPYFQDVYDHLLRVAESSDSLRDLVGTIVETNLSLRDYRQNQVMKKVTSWAAIIAVPTLVTGFYGMNVPYPGFARHWGVWFSIAVMVAASAALYATFRRRDWL